MNFSMNTAAKTLLAALTLSAPLFAASTAARHSVYDMDESEREAYAPAVKTLLHQDTAVAATGLESLPCGEYFSIQDQVPAVKPALEDSSTKTAWVWAGAGGAVVAAGVAAWIILSGDEPGAQPVHVIME